MLNEEGVKAEITRLVNKLNEVKASGRLKGYGEENTKKDFITPLFRALGWDVENRETPDEVTNEDRVSKGRVDYAFRLNEIPKFFLEAKALNKGLVEPDDADQAINYAWHKNTTWAVLTDFQTLVVYNAEVKGKTLSDSQFIRLTCDQFVEQFQKLYLLSKPAFQETLLDKEALGWGKKLRKTKVGDQLLQELMQYRELLSKNILKSNATKNLSEEEIDEAVQRIIDRLIFIRTTEDRQIEQPLLLPKAREFEEKRKGKLTTALNEIYLQFDKNYDSRLFTRHLCETLDIESEILLQVITGLYQSKDGLTHYDFSAIDADVLGNIYEQYLGHLLKKTKKRAKIESKEAHRKEQGIYYTPTYIVDYIVRNTLGEMIKNKKPADVDKIRVLDMACGSGSFLLKAFDVLDDYYKKHDKNYAQSNLDLESEAAKITRKTKILKNNLYGVDLDPKAVEIAQLNLLLKSAETKHRLPDLNENIKRGNSLIDQSLAEESHSFNWKNEFEEIIKAGGFDVVVGNPPYINAIQLTKDVGEGIKNYWKTKYVSAQGAYDIYVLFFEQALRVLKDGGYLGFITPNKYFSSPYGIALREYLQKEYTIREIIDLSSVQVFNEPSVYPVITIIQKKKSNKKYEINVKKPVDEKIYSAKGRKVSSEWLYKLPEKLWGGLLVENIDLIDKIFSDSKLLEDVAVVQATTTAGEADTYSKHISETKGTPIINTGLIDRFSTSWGLEFFSNKGTKLKTPKLDVNNKEISENRRKLYATPKIILAKLALRPEAFLDKKGDFASINTNCVHSPKENLNLEFLAAVINSKLTAFVYSALFQGLKMGGGYYQYQAPQLRILPVKIPTPKQLLEFNKEVAKMLQLQEDIKKCNKQTEQHLKIEKEIKTADAKIDELVYGLYGLTAEEQRIVEEAAK